MNTPAVTSFGICLARLYGGDRAQCVGGQFVASSLFALDCWSRAVPETTTNSYMVAWA